MLLPSNTYWKWVKSIQVLESCKRVTEETRRLSIFIKVLQGKKYCQVSHKINSLYFWYTLSSQLCLHEQHQQFLIYCSPLIIFSSDFIIALFHLVNHYLPVYFLFYLDEKTQVVFCDLFFLNVPPLASTQQDHSNEYGKLLLPFNQYPVSSSTSISKHQGHNCYSVKAYIWIQNHRSQLRRKIF